ncbi:MAG: hypothetical protein K2K80_04875 [Clostridia bacterium]|nr:hypothetical protein [Clostridia bacterium]
MYEKLNNGDDLFDHEVLEILLYSVCPRVNTNPLAHALLDRFVTLNEVFNASIDELKEVDGVGESVARFIKAVGQCAERAGNIGNSPTLKTLGDCNRFIDLRLRGKSEEFIELYFLNKANRVQRIFTYTSAEKSRVSVKIDEIVRSFALFRPYGVIIAHNHIDGTENPSGYDDDFTCTVQFICNLNGAKLLDHLIYKNKDKIYSYNACGRLDRVKSFCSWDTFEKWIKTLN